MKKFFLKLSKILSTSLLIGSIVAALSGMILIILPDVIESLGIEGLGLEEVAWLTGALTIIASSGGMVKYSANAIRAITKLSESDIQIQLRLQNEKHQAEIDNIREQHSEELVVFTETVNDMVDELNHIRIQNEKIMELNMITAKRNINSNLVTEEDKQLYINFVNNYDNTERSNLKNVYVSITNTIEKVESVNETKEDLLTKALEEKQV